MRLEHADPARGPGHPVPADRRRPRRRRARRPGCAPRCRHVALHPAAGRLARLVGPDGELPVVEVGPRRWGRRSSARRTVALTSRWAGYRWGPTRQAATGCDVLPVRAPFDSRAEAPQPLGLVGAHRSRRPGDGTEFAVDPAVPHRGPAAADQLAGLAAHRRAARRQHPRPRRTPACCSWSTRWPTTAARAASTATPSSLDVTVRAAAALAEHHVRRGDRVALRVVGARRRAGAVRRRASATCATASRPAGHGCGRDAARPARASSSSSARPPATRGLVLSPMLADGGRHRDRDAAARRAAGAGGRHAARPTPCPPVVEGTDPRVADLAWRMRRSSARGARRLAALGCPVVAWRGPGHARRRAAPAGAARPAAPGACPMSARVDPGPVGAARDGGRGGPVLLALLATAPGGRARRAPGWCVLVAGLSLAYARLPESAGRHGRHGARRSCWWASAFRADLHAWALLGRGRPAGRARGRRCSRRYGPDALPRRPGDAAALAGAAGARVPAGGPRAAGRGAGAARPAARPRPRGSGRAGRRAGRGRASLAARSSR